MPKNGFVGRSPTNDVKANLLQLRLFDERYLEAKADHYLLVLGNRPCAYPD
jgi:hypothetical protein